MMTPLALNWHEANQAYLSALLTRIRELLLSQSQDRGTPTPDLPHTSRDLSQLQVAIQQAQTALPAPAALDQLISCFDLSPFERDILLLCAGMEMDESFPRLCAAAQADLQRPYPTLGLALAALPSPSWQAITPEAPLRRWQLIEIGKGSSLTLGPLRIDERVMHHLVGLSQLDARLKALIKPVTTRAELVASHRALVDRITMPWSQSRGRDHLPLLLLTGEELGDKRAIALGACQGLGLALYRLSVQALPTTPSDLRILALLWNREARLHPAALLLEGEIGDPMDSARLAALQDLILEIETPMLLSCQERWSLPQVSHERVLIGLDVDPPTRAEQRALWRQGLTALADQLQDAIEALVGHFSLSAAQIRSVCDQTQADWATVSHAPDPQQDLQHPDLHPSSHLPQLLWDTCRRQARQSMEGLAQRIEPAATWQDLVLPEGLRQVLQEIAAHVRQRTQVYEAWGFDRKSSRGMGISALFAGASGTGKTMAAEVIAGELHLDLYRIDLSTVVSKYIGETEKNLSRVFSAAEAGGAILLFDEADALFGKRSEVKDSHDRYANMEVAYLLQRMEAYRGLSILTTNLKDSIDLAFLRRIRFMLRFPFPDGSQRAEIWRRVFPAETPIEGLKYQRLAQLQVTGGNIRNIALNAAFLAADAGEPLRMIHVLQAARNEYSKLERTLTESEIKGWI